MDIGEAPRACASCKKNKRGCDKGLPQCSLCTRHNRVCDYSDNSQINYRDELEDLRSRVQELEQRLTPVTLTPAASSINDLLNPDNSAQHVLYHDLSAVASYIDSDTSATCNIPNPSNHVPAPEDISSVLSLSDMEEIKYRYFDSVHTWMPIVSKIRLDRITNYDQGQGHSNLYNVTKKLSQELEFNGIITVRAVQAGLLLCVYEVGHGIFPAAFLNISSCARQGVALGLHNKLAPQLAGTPRSWVDWEERQRVWWMVVILDRYIAIGSDHRPLCTEDPNKDTLLPASDDAWDSGEMMCPERVLLSSNSDTPVSPFARLAQASNLLGLVVKHCNDTSMEIEYVLDNFERLTQTLIAFLQLLTTSQDLSSNPFTTAAAICFSALFKLANHHSCDMHIEQDLGIEIATRVREIMQRSVQMLKDTSNQVVLFVRDARQSLNPQTMELVSPLVLNCIYSSTANLSWMGLENGAPQYAIGKAVCEEMLQSLGARWKVANAYLELQRVADRDQEEHA
ncbi:uncharacterized protein N7484_005119 [Penicillium longicatenatum]|uniref:uncharacterized protein n=1 Tax=Penicillium longicatenatum TaxID=1561947 RepID=UPI002547F158|nr:uncharacterized protein N7484_005119 [Penicillium longicatenatum]KAJ5651396.1 hypothetical protein N7484_005119 [Penicillium longicatenatum]